MNLISRRTFARGAGACLAFPSLLGCTDDRTAKAGIRVIRTPGEGIVPSAAFASDGILHVVYLEDQNVYHVSSADRGSRFGGPVRVNDRVAFATGGLFRGPELALGSDGTIHVVWYSRAWELKAEQGAMYARGTSDARFEPSRNVAREPSDGLSVASFAAQVAITWHNGNTLKLLRSDDAGRSFAPAQSLDALPCECCDTSLCLTRTGSAWVVYRDRLNDHRDMFMASLPHSEAPGRKVRLDAQTWVFDACPVSGNGASFSDDAAVVAWERDGRILMAQVALGDLRRSDPLTIGQGKFPLVLRNADTVLVAWSEAKQLNWHLYDAVSSQRRDAGSVPRSTTHRAGGAVAPGGEFVLVV